MNAFPMYRSLRRGPAACLLLLLLSSCSLAPWHSDKQAPPAPEPAPVVAAPPPLPVPMATHRFVLPEDGSTVVGDVVTVELTKDDTLPDIARRFDVGYEEIVRANPGVDPWLPGAGRKVVVPTQFVLPNAPHEGIVINVAAMRVFYYPKREAGKQAVVYTYPIGIGKVGWKTPEGTTRVTGKKKDPVWRPSAGLRKDKADEGDPVDAVVPAGPDNPLGKFEFVLGWPSYLIHGTNKPYGVGLRSSHGCVRLYPEDIEQLFSMTPIGTRVTVVNQPFVFGWHGDQLYLQPYTVLEDDPRNWQKAQKTLLAKSLSTQIGKDLKKKSLQLDWEAVSAVTHQPRGLPVAVAGEIGTVDAVVANAPQVANRLPDGSNWSGDDGTADAAGVQQLLSEQEPGPDAVPASPGNGKTAKTGT
ncbi:MAG TPA: L,D-transpeptidase family protein [Steroidobacteraceae bacterium]|nr:L,D-transpeptidase family protein [Steroidobacteraceae bacterium]